MVKSSNGLKRSVLAVCNICLIKTVNYIEVQMYLFGINGLNKIVRVRVLCVLRHMAQNPRSNWPTWRRSSLKTNFSQRFQIRNKIRNMSRSFLLEGAGGGGREDRGGGGDGGSCMKLKQSTVLYTEDCPGPGPKKWLYRFPVTAELPSCLYLTVR